MSDAVRSLDQVERLLLPQLKAKGFRKSGRTFSREGEDRILFFLNLQMGQYPIGDYVIPGLRESLYGKFAVNIGVFVPQIYELENTVPLPKKVSEPYSQFRDRLKKESTASDQWYDLSKNDEQTAAQIGSLFETTGERFFDSFSSHSKIFQYYEEHRDFPMRNHFRATFDVALLKFAIGEHSEYTHLLEYILANSEHKGFREHVQEVDARIQRQRVSR